MTQDLNKRISSIQYNLLNLPQNITFSTGSTIAYTYDAEGRKLNVTYGSPSKTINYSGNMVYENGTLKQILTEGGYVTLSGTTPTYHAYLRDHQGNNRVVIDGSGTIEQVNHYYPFGYFFGESTNADTQRYKYNDKEFDEMHGLHWYDYGARHYDPAIMRFTTMDPMCEKYYHLSPYAYCGNNPVNAVDPTGMTFDLSNMSNEQIESYNKSISFLIENSPLFANLYQSLEMSEQVYKVSLGMPQHNGKNIDGQFILNESGGGDIILSESKFSENGIDNSTYSEEFFHAYQHDNRNFYDRGSFNREFEAKTFATIVGLDVLGGGSYNGMEIFQSNITEGIYGNNVQAIIPNDSFLNDYNAYANKYAQYNINNNIGNINYQKPTNIKPYSLIKVINNTYYR